MAAPPPPGPPPSLAGRLMTMPVLIVNMGGEMVYILEQRLQAQKIPDSKGQKVLNDVVRTMYYPRFIEELFKPQEMYSIHSTRQIFDRLAHSSIMRLNEASMDKLFDLMAMGFKFQIISCLAPREMIDVTMNHLDALKRLATGNQQLVELLDECVRQMNLAYGNMSLADLVAMRQSLCAFFQDRKVKVSLFLHDHTQNHDGSIVVASGGTLPADRLPPGTVRYFGEGGVETSRTTLSAASTNAWKQGSVARTRLGSNLYEKDKSSKDGAPPAAAPPAEPAPPVPSPPSSAVPPTPEDTSGAAARAVSELNMLASLIGAPAPNQVDNFKLENLFGSNVFQKDAKPKAAEVIEIDGCAPSAYAEGLDQIRNEFDVAAPPPGPPPEDDLLDLLDQA
eukprot:TRINITY_DN75880_c0_g1_i1.p1 TRINITY_DN75880_c0_g1~~TRINITY_DN75880_c0_g1_i1.p1  ORF type:complete len:393 (-),score=105.11 TRINITY_DN75880_c0_g1_i1:77-1255(-)